MMDTILPCLWCDPKLVLVAPSVNTADATVYWVFCPDCGMHGPSGTSEKVAVARWNFISKSESPQPSAPVQPVAWPNHCDEAAPRALRFLASHERPCGGESMFNSAHLLQLADEIEQMAKLPLYASPSAQPEEAVIAPGPKKDNGAVSVQRVEIHKMSDGTYITMTPSGYGENILGEVPPDEAWINWLFERELEDIISDHTLKSAPEPSVAAEAIKLAGIDIDPAAIHALKEHQRQLDRDGVEVGVSRQALDEVIIAIERIGLSAPAAHPGIVPGWVKCSERMPEGVDWFCEPIASVVAASFAETGFCLFWRKARYVVTKEGVRYADVGWYDGDEKLPQPTHWMPLPAAPKG